jgi:hypothetical protein
MYGLGLVGGILALAASRLRLTGSFVLAVMLVLGAVLAVLGLELAPFERQPKAGSALATDPRQG